MTEARSITPRLLALLLGAALLAPDRAAGFAEDLCHENGRVQNCVGGDREGRRPPVSTRFRAMFGLWNANVERNGRSMIHVDSTFFIAQAVGLRWDIAYWIAAYDEVADVTQYIPFGSDGQLLEDSARWQTVRLNGFHRTGRQVAGTLYHFPAPYLPPGQTRLPPDVRSVRPALRDALHEGTLVHFRRWALEDGIACTGGFTTRSPEGSYFTGSSCFPATEEPNIRGKVPVLAGVGFTFAGKTGPQLTRFTMTDGPDGKTIAPDSMVHSRDLQALLDTGTGRLADEQAPVPAALVRMGIYLHILQDRISHEDCLNHSYVTGPDEQGRFIYHFDRKTCNPSKHAFGHHQEIGWPKLPERTFSALEYTYDELARFVESIRNTHPDWLSGAPRIERSQLIRDDGGNPGMLGKVLSVKGGCARLKAMNQAITAAGYPLMPGNRLEDPCP